MCVVHAFQNISVRYTEQTTEVVEKWVSRFQESGVCVCEVKFGMFFSVQFLASWQWEGLKLAHRFSSSKHVGNYKLMPNYVTIFHIEVA